MTTPDPTVRRFLYEGQAAAPEHTHPDTATTAANVTVTPGGTLNATDVQTALLELDSEKAVVGHTHGTGGEPVAPTATSTTFTPTGGLSSTNVQAALAELDTEKAPAEHTHPATARPVNLQAMIAGPMSAGTNVLPPGIRVPVDGTATLIVHAVGTAPSGADALLDVLVGPLGGATRPLGSPNITNGQRSRDLTVSVAVTAGEFITFNIPTTNNAADALVSIDITPSA